MRRRGSDYTRSGGGYPSSKMMTNPFSMNGSVNRSKGDAGGMRMKSLNRPNHHHYAADIEGGHGEGGEAAGGKCHRDDSDSQNSRSQIIKKTRTFAVETFPHLGDVSTSMSRARDVDRF